MALPFGFSTIFDFHGFAEGIDGVSVVIPLFNYAEFVTSALDSVANQTHVPLELIVVNDQSTDQSEREVIRWMDSNKHRFTRCRIFRNDENYGLATSRNHGFKSASHKFIFALDADNEIYPTAIQRLLRACILANAQAAYSQLEMFGDQSDVGRAYAWERERFVRGNYIDAMALIRKSAWERVGGYALMEVQGWEDYDLWCKFIEEGFEAVFVPQILCRYRVHERSMLRMETNPEADRVIQEMIYRHPWLLTK
jgi:glycosyltransferase involved in cell wall biosynthesis